MPIYINGMGHYRRSGRIGNIILVICWCIVIKMYEIIIKNITL